MIKRHWKRVSGLVVLLIILLMAFLERRWLLEALEMVRGARPAWLLLAPVCVLCSYLITSLVFQITLRAQGYNLGLLRLWATALVSILLSQSIPAGGVWSYAFLISVFKRRGVPSGQATLVATIDVVSYSIAMLSIVFFGMIYLAVHNLTVEEGSYVAAAIALLLITLTIFVLTRSEEQLKRWLLAIKDRLARLFRLSWSDEKIIRLILELTTGRQMIASNPTGILFLGLLQFAALSCHGLALWMVLRGLGAHTTFLVVMAALGLALITSTFNLLPGGGGTVEAVLIATLYQLGIGTAALPGAILFRLLNFWLLIPLAAICYYWLTHERPPHKARVSDLSSTVHSVDASGE